MISIAGMGVTIALNVSDSGLDLWARLGYVACYTLMMYCRTPSQKHFIPYDLKCLPLSRAFNRHMQTGSTALHGAVRSLAHQRLLFAIFGSFILINEPELRKMLLSFIKSEKHGNPSS